MSDFQQSIIIYKERVRNLPAFWSGLILLLVLIAIPLIVLIGITVFVVMLVYTILKAFTNTFLGRREVE